MPGPKGRTVKLQDSKKRKAPALPHRERAFKALEERHPRRSGAARGRQAETLGDEGAATGKKPVRLSCNTYIKGASGSFV